MCVSIYKYYSKNVLLVFLFQKKSSLESNSETNADLSFASIKKKKSSTFSAMSDRPPVSQKSSTISNSSNGDAILSVQQSNTFRTARYSYF